MPSPPPMRASSSTTCPLTASRTRWRAAGWTRTVTVHATSSSAASGPSCRRSAISCAGPATPAARSSTRSGERVRGPGAGLVSAGALGYATARSIPTSSKEGLMIKMLRTVLLAGVFAAGFLCGSLTQRPAQAQLGELGNKAMEQAGGAGGAVGAAAKLGTAIPDIQTHIDGLQKNLETLKAIKTALGG